MKNWETMFIILIMIISDSVIGETGEGESLEKQIKK